MILASEQSYVVVTSMWESDSTIDILKTVHHNVGQIVIDEIKERKDQFKLDVSQDESQATKASHKHNSYFSILLYVANVLHGTTYTVRPMWYDICIYGYSIEGLTELFAVARETIQPT